LTSTTNWNADKILVATTMETKVIINKKVITRVATRATKMSTTTISTMIKEEQTVNRGMHRTTMGRLNT